MHVKFWQTIVRFWVFLSYLITTVTWSYCSQPNSRLFRQACSSVSHSRFFHNSLWYMTSHVHDVVVVFMRCAPRTTCPRAVIYRSILADRSSIFHPKSRAPFFILFFVARPCHALSCAFNISWNVVDFLFFSDLS